MISMHSFSDFNIKVCYQAGLCNKVRCVATLKNPEIATYKDNVTKYKDLAMIILFPLSISRLIEAK
jgi:hypothetical protein